VFQRQLLLLLLLLVLTSSTVAVPMHHALNTLFNRMMFCAPLQSDTPPPSCCCCCCCCCRCCCCHILSYNSWPWPYSHTHTWFITCLTRSPAVMLTFLVLPDLQAMVTRASCKERDILAGSTHTSFGWRQEQQQLRSSRCCQTSRQGTSGHP
jgi:hypothetical protein